MTLASGDAAGEGAGVVLFDCCKKETHTHKQGFKQLFRRLRGTFKPTSNEEEISLEKLKTAAICVFGAPREMFTTKEINAIKDFLMGGGSVLLLMGEGGEAALGTNLNYLTEELGIMVNNDCVVRTVYQKYLHPKEVLITDGVLNREINNVAGKGTKGSDRADLKKPKWAETEADQAGPMLRFAYPYGATLSVQKPAVSLLSSGKIAYPMHRPIGAAWQNKGGKGRLVVLGSVQMFDDTWLDREENGALMDFVFRWLAPGSNVQLYGLDAEEPDVAEYHHLPDTEALAERLRSCLQEGEEVPKDFTTLFDDLLFKLDTALIPEAVELYSKLGVKHAPLTLISPQFEKPLPPLQPAVFPPALKEPPPPALDLFDLDEHFASEKGRLANITNKCMEGSDEDIEFYVREACNILGVTQKVGARKLMCADKVDARCCRGNKVDAGCCRGNKVALALSLLTK
eukprot:jgi/Mesvir1/14473/Mv05180-RA.2